MKRIIKLTENQLNLLVKKVLEKESLQEQITPVPGNPTTGNSIARGGTSTASAGAYISPRGLQFSPTEDNPYDPYDPYDPDDPNRYPKPGSYESKLGRSPMCCKKCKNGKFKHQCGEDQKGGKLKYDGTNCVYATISDCQLNKRSGKKKRNK